MNNRLILDVVEYIYICIIQSYNLLASEVLKRWRTPCLDVIFQYKQNKNRKFIPAQF